MVNIKGVCVLLRERWLNKTAPPSKKVAIQTLLV
jgi:hypothetical protein